jgi:hypothetical protein
MQSNHDHGQGMTFQEAKAWKSGQLVVDEE